MSVQKPTVGRRVYYYASVAHYLGSISGDVEVAKNSQPFDAGVLYVHDDRHVNLLVTDAHGTQTFIAGVRLWQEGDDAPNGAHARWMPYQVKAQKEAEKAKMLVAAETAAVDAAGLMKAALVATEDSVIAQDFGKAKETSLGGVDNLGAKL